MYSTMSPLLPIITIILCFAPSTSTSDHPPPYLYPSTFSTDYQTMLSTFKIFPYTLNHTTSAVFHSSLLSSTFITSDPTEAHLFYLPTPPDIRTRSLERVISRVRSSFPFWNRSLAADHFFLSSCSLSSAPAAPSSSARNVVELRKNAVRVSCFPAPKGNYFIPHKDVSLPPPPLTRSPLDPTRPGQKYKHLAYFKTTGTTTSTTAGAELIGELKADQDFKVESWPLDDEAAYVDTLKSSKFCLFVYGGGEVAGLGEALTCGCVPVVITDRPIQDMPLMDVVRWQEIALFVGSGVGPAGLKRMLNEVVGGGKYEKMKRSGVAAAQHFVWNEPPKPYDAFHMVVYQLWMRRHVIRYATSDRR